MRILMFILALTFACGVSVYAVDSTKPDTHNATWERSHGQAAKANEAECLACHEERVECIACHEDVSPRNHNSAWVQKNHGLESRWNRMKCSVCHKEDFCESCHEEAVPRSHTRANFRGGSNLHCTNSCQLPYGTWKNTPAKNCIICHKTRPIISTTGQLHAIN